MVTSRVSIFLTACLASISGLGLAAPAPADLAAHDRVLDNNASPLPGYIVAAQTWDVEISLGNFAPLNGTVQEVVAQASKLNPNFASTLDENLTETTAEAAIKSNDVTVGIANGHTQCGLFPAADVKGYQKGIDYLRTIGKGYVTLPPGHRVCKMVSCEPWYFSAIWLCNDNAYELHIGGMNGWDVVANSAQHLLDSCTWENTDPVNEPHKDKMMVSAGQIFEEGEGNGGWNIILAQAAC